MKKVVVSSSILLAVCGILLAPSAVQAAGSVTPQTTPIGPSCLSTAPFSDTLVWFFDFNGLTANWIYFDGIGQDLSGNRSQSVSAFVDTTGTTLHVGYTTYPKPGFVPVIAGGTIDVATLTGPGQCYAPDFDSCGDFTFQIITCPTGPGGASTGHSQGQR